MDSPDREMEEADEFVLVPEVADLRSYQLDEDADEHEARFLAGNREKTIDVNYFASEPASNAAAKCGTSEATATAAAGAESDVSVDDDVEDVDGLSDEDEEGLQTGEVEVEAAEEPGCKVREGDHGWQQHAVGVICSVGLAAAATGLALLLGGQQQTPHRVHFQGSGGSKVWISADLRLTYDMTTCMWKTASIAGIFS
jgi:hypothetical protein